MGIWDDYKKSLKATGGKVKKVNYGNTMQTAGASSGAPLSMPKVGDALPKVEIGPVQWQKPVSAPSMSRVGNALPKVEVPKSRLSSAIDRANQAALSEYPTKSIVNRGNNIAKGLGTSLAYSAPLLAEGTKQTMKDWQSKVKNQGMAGAMRDYAYNLDNPSYSFGSPINTNSKAYKNYARSQDYYRKALEGLTPMQQEIGQLGISALESASTLPAAFINPSAPLVLMGTKAAAGRAYELTGQGKSAMEATGRGLLSGGLEALTEKIPLDDLLQAAKGGKNVLKSLLKQANVEGAEELASYILNYAADRSAGDESAKFSVPEAIKAYAGGALTGAAMGGTSAALGNYMASFDNRNAMPKVGDMLPRVPDILPKKSNYSSDISDVNVNIGDMTAAEYLKRYNEGILKQKNNTMPSVYDNMMPYVSENTLPKVETPKQTAQKADRVYHGIVQAKTNLFESGILKNFNKARKFFVDYARNNFKPAYINKETGAEIGLGRTALDKMLSGNITYEKYASAFHIPELIENATYTGDAPNAHFEKPEQQKNIKTYSYYESPIRIDNKNYMAYMRVRNTGMGSKYYGHTLAEIVDDIKIEPLETRTFSAAAEVQPVTEVSNDFNNIIPETSQKINTQAAETRLFDGSGDDFDLSNTLSDTDVSAYNFIRKTAEQKNVSEKKVYEAYKKGRDVLFNSIVDETFEVYKKYRPQGTQLINTTENMGGGTLDRMQRISNNEKWYSEAYKEYGRKPNQSQLRQFIEKKVEADIRRGGGEYMDSATAKKLNTFDALLSGYDKITENGTRDVADIRKGNNGAYEVGYNIPEADKRSKKERLNDSASIISKLKDSIPALSEMEPVSKITGTEFQKGTERITDTVGRFFASLGNKVFRKGFGNIVIDVDGIKDSIAHGIGKRKAAAFKAVPDILAMGEQIDVQSNWKGRNYDTYVFAAPIQVGNEINYVAAVVKNSGSSNRYYLHEVVDQSGNIIYSNKKSDGNNDSSAIGFKTTSIGANNPSLNNSIPKTSEKNNNNLGIISPEMQQLFEASETAKKSFEKAYQFGVSGTAPFERMAKADTRENARNINALSNKYSQKGGIVNTLLTEGMYDINGNKVDGRSFVQVASQVPKNQLAAFNDYWHELHNIDRQAQGKPVTEHTAEQSKEIVKNYEAQHPEFKEYLKNISDYYDLFIRTWGIGSGIISEKSYLQMKQMYPYYVPTFRVDDGVAGSGGYAQGKKIRNGNAIGKAKGGTQEVISFDEAFARKINSVVAAATKNDISREIFSFAQTMPAEAARNGVLIETDKSSQYAEQMDIDDLMDSIDKNIAREISKGKYEITFYDNGRPQTMKINKDVWNAFNFLDDRVGSEGYRFFAGLGRKLTNPMRAMTTTYNPLFFLTNLMRDAQTYTINNTAKNSAYAMKNYVKALKGIVTKADTFKQYKALGGSQNGYYGKDIYANAERAVMPQAKTAGQKALGVLRSPLTAVEALGEFTEKIPRYAEYLNTIERLGDTDAGRLQASLNAADVTVNFNRSSTLSSMANAWVPYFNAGLQGMDKTFRQIKAHPVQTGARAVASVFLPTLLLYIVNKDNPHWEDVKDGVRDNYYLIPNPMGPYDENGNAETFIRLPKSREFGALFSTSFERFIRAINSEEDTKNTLPDAFDGYLDTLLNSVMPNSVLDDNILGAMKRLGTNTAWHGGKIVPSNLENVSPRYQYDINTSGAAMRLAGMTENLPFVPDWTKSPMKLDYIIDSYGGYAGDLLQGLTSRKNIGATDAETVKNSLYNGFIQPFKNRFNTDSVYSNYNLDRFYDMTDALEMAANDRNMAENLPPEYKTPEESVYSDFVSARGDITDITKQERAVLETPMSMAEKNRQIRELKKQKSEIAKGMMEDKDRLYENYKAEYLPELSVQNEKKQEKLRDLQSSYNMPDSTLNNILANYNSIKKIPDDKKSDLEKTIDFYNYLDSIGYTSDYAVRDDLDELLRYGNVAQSQVEKYNSVSGFISPDEYENLGKYLDDITWEKGKSGAKSIALKNGIDDWIQYYGLNLSGNERRSLYLSQGVGKSYTY